MNARLAPLLLFAGAMNAARLDAQRIIVRDAGPGSFGHRLAEMFASPHRLIGPAATPAILPRDSAYAQTVVVLHRDVVIEGRVHGDVIVVGGDAFLRPGAVVDGRVIAVGGAVYESRLAITRNGVESHRDFTYDARTNGTSEGYLLDYRLVREHPSSPLSLPGVYGVRIPGYDRSDGLSLPFGPTISLDTGYLEINPIVTYRSNIGAFDPSLDGEFAFDRRTRVHAYFGRTTLSNDDWIWTDLVNSSAVLGLGLDTRNYYRGDRGEVTLHRLLETSMTELAPFVGLRAERDRSIRPDSFATGGPWSFFGRRAADDMLRPNPPIVPGTLESVLFGVLFDWQLQGVRTSFNLTNEAAAFDVGSLRFLQSTLDGVVRFPTFGAQFFYLSTHVVYTFGDTAPPQRWSYLGGSGTITTLPLLSLGGDRLVYIESNYYAPIPWIDLPIVGAPSITLRHMIGSAGVGRLPSFEQNLGLRLALSFLRFDGVVDPATRTWDFGFGLSMAR
ncbi:MAG TPA: polymer-forming cytoskeletal protein [Gemmatimonadaceae bacterium]